MEQGGGALCTGEGGGGERGIGRLSTKNVMSSSTALVRYTFHRFHSADISDGIIRIRTVQERKTARYVADFMDVENRLA